MTIDTPTNSRPGDTMPPRSEARAIEGDGGADGAYARLLADADRRAAIRLHAYYRAERRGFVPGHELDDWLAAERQMAEIDAIREQQSRAQSQAWTRSPPIRASVQSR
jgi:hypothetical protein